MGGQPPASVWWRYMARQVLQGHPEPLRHTSHTVSRDEPVFPLTTPLSTPHNTYVEWTAYTIESQGGAMAPVQLSCSLTIDRLSVILNACNSWVTALGVEACTERERNIHWHQFGVHAPICAFSASPKAGNASPDYLPASASATCRNRLLGERMASLLVVFDSYAHTRA